MESKLYFQVHEKSRNFFLSAAPSQSVGDALSPYLDGKHISKLEASRTMTVTESRTDVPPDTPCSVLRDFGTNHIFVGVTDPAPVNDTPVINVFTVLMNVHKAYDRLPKQRTEHNSKDRLYNQVLSLLKKEGVGFTPMQVDTTGENVVKTLTDTLWYLDPHREKFASRSIDFCGFEEFQGFNNWRSQKIKEPKVTTDELDRKLSAMVTMSSNGYFLNETFRTFRSLCNILIEGMKKYLDFLKKQAERTAFNHTRTEPVRSLSDNTILRDAPVCSSSESNESYANLKEALDKLSDFDPLFLHEFEPDDAYDRKVWLQKLELPYQVKVYAHKYGNYIGNYNFVWKSPLAIENRAEKDIETLSKIKLDLVTYSTRGMRRDFINKYSRVGPKPIILRHMFRYLTDDGSAAESKEQDTIDQRVAELLLQTDSTCLIFDLRANNGRPKDEKLDPFWNALDTHLNGISVVDERRHGSQLFMPIDISVESLIETVAETLPAGAKLPSPSWVAFNFWPCNQYVRSAMCYTGRFHVKYAVQQRLTRAKHPDSGFAFHQYTMLKDMSIQQRELSIFICLDDKSVVPIGEPGKPISTGVRAHHKSMVPIGTTLSALDHDFHIHGVVPSVLFHVDIPENVNDSFYNGKVHVTVKDKVFQPSSAIRHTTETVNIIRNESSTDGISSDKPLLFVYTDGGPDHRTSYWTVQLAYIAMFIALDLDMLVAARTAPCQSYNNPAERCMSVINIALQNVALERDSMIEGLEMRVKSLTGLKKLRNVAEKDNTIKSAMTDALDPVIAKLKLKFSKLKLHKENVVVHDAASAEDMDLIATCLDIFKDKENDQPVLSAKSKDLAPQRLKVFMETHTRTRTYTYQIRKCADDSCGYCVLFPKRDETPELQWLPDPTLGPDEKYLPFSDCCGTVTTDCSRPSMTGKVVATEADKTNKKYMNAAQARAFIICQECGKRRIVYSRQRLDRPHINAIDHVQDQFVYTCGGTLFSDGHKYRDTVFVREGIQCSSEMETTYYGVGQKFPPVCFFCGDTEILGHEDEPIVELRKQYAIVRPICGSCHSSGKQPAVRNALKMKKKK